MGWWIQLSPDKKPLTVEEQTQLVLEFLFARRWNRYITEHPQKSRPTKHRAAGVPSYKLERERGYVT